MPTPEYEEEPAAEAYEEETYYPEPDGVTAQGVVGSIDIRPSFIERLMEMDESVIEWHAQLQEHLTSYRKVKSRYSARCDSYRMGRDLLAKKVAVRDCKGNISYYLYSFYDRSRAAKEEAD